MIPLDSLKDVYFILADPILERVYSLIGATIHYHLKDKGYMPMIMVDVVWI